MEECPCYIACGYIYMKAARGKRMESVAGAAASLLR